MSRTSMRKVAGASMVGTTIEWYDFFLYGSAAALVFNKLFFPEADPLVGTMLAFMTYSVGFVARPLGGIVFGRFTWQPVALYLAGASLISALDVLAARGPRGTDLAEHEPAAEPVAVSRT